MANLGVTLKKELDRPLTHEEMDSNFELLRLLVATSLGGNAQAVFNENGKIVGFEFSLIGLNNFLMREDGRNWFAQKVTEAMMTEQVRGMMANLTCMPVTGSALEAMVSGMAQGQRVFDVDTKKTLTFYDGKFYDAMGNVEYDFTSSTQ